MLPLGRADIVPCPKDAPPRLVVIVDTEEEFDWAAPFSTANRSVKTVAEQSRAQRIFEKFGVVPTYAVDYPVASQADGFLPLREMMQSGQCEIGAHLHPWVTPPVEEEVCERNSFACNLPEDLERKKLEQLTAIINENFGHRPKLYRAGRYGAGANTTAILEALGYEIDCSVVPGQSVGKWGPDYRGGIASPYWLQGTKRILEIPVTVATVGAVGRFGDDAYNVLASPLGRRLKVPAVMARLGIMDRIRLTPEGTTLAEARHLTRRMFEAGQRVFAVSYHSPSLAPGHTQYVRNAKELESFLGWLEGYLEFFFTEMQGLTATPHSIREWAKALSGSFAVRLRDEAVRVESGRRISVVIPARNSSATLARALDSVINQTVKPLETIVVDDQSTDDTVSIAESYAEHGVRVVSITQHGGAAGARNEGIRAAEGELIAFLDSDDEWSPTKLEKQLAVLENNPQLSLVSCASIIIAPDGTVQGDTFGGHRPTLGSNAWKALLHTNFIATPTVLARRDQLLSLGGFDRKLKVGEDQDMWIRLALIGDLDFVQETLVFVHERQNSLSNGALEDQLDYTLPMIERHLSSLEHRMTPAEIRRIKGERMSRVGRLAYVRGKRALGLKLIMRASMLGHNLIENGFYIVNASGPAIWLKAWIRDRSTA